MADSVEEEDLPFAAEYAKSGRASCRACKKGIPKDSLRLAVMIQSPMFDGKMPNWHHHACFFKSSRLKSVADVKNFDQLRFEDQEMIRKQIIPHGEAGIHEGIDPKSTLLQDFKVESAKSSRSLCRGCNEKIVKDAIRISKKDRESDKARRFGPVDQWYHVHCFADKRDEMEFFAGGDVIPGFKQMKPEEQATINEKLPVIKQKGIKRSKQEAASASSSSVASDEPSKKKKKKDDVKNIDEEKQLKAQSIIIYGFRDQLQKEVSKKDLQYLSDHNDLGTHVGESRLLDCISDAMAFGALNPCPECKNGRLKLATGGYACTGNITEWTKCAYFTKIPERRKFLIPSDMKKDYPFLKSYKAEKIRARVFPAVVEQPTSTKDKDEPDKPSNSKPLSGMKFAIVGKTVKASDDLKQDIEALGGNIVTKIDDSLVAIISSQVEFNKFTKKKNEAKALNIHVVSEDFVEEAKKGKVAELIAQKNIVSWGGDLSSKIKTEKSGSQSGEAYTKNVPKTMKMTIKGGAIVNPASGVSHETHVLVEDKTIYNAVLGMVDVKRGTNSFYQLQILESDVGKSYMVFRAWGRIGTSIGGNKLEKMMSKDNAVKNFKELYLEKTGNTWEHRETAAKKSNKFYPIDVDYGQDDSVKSLREMSTKTPSKLPKSIQDLVCMIFDIELMKSAMLEFELDMVKMPLGKLSKRQIEQAYAVLTEVQTLIEQGGSHSKFMDASNRFFTLIPHNFGMKKPPLLNDGELIKSKIEMLDSLLEIELAYNLLKGTDSDEENAIDSHFDKLNIDMEELATDTEEFKRLEMYTKNTHAATHNQYELKIRNIFKVNRHGEAARYKPFKKLPNRMLLWHGSRTSNYAGILSQGLRIAPPEAPVTGYMFGKGVYFADMVSKSANYCRTSKEHPIGILLLCEVALGNMYELLAAEHVTKLPIGKHSTKGKGSTQPNPSKNVVDTDGVVIPLGEGTSSNLDRPTLLYNEYIVYDTAQVNVKYLLELDFDYKF